MGMTNLEFYNASDALDRLWEWNPYFGRFSVNEKW